MWRLYDYYCDTCKIIKEYLINDLERDSQVCDTCNDSLHREVSAPKGYVKGTFNPVKQ